MNKKIQRVLCFTLLISILAISLLVIAACEKKPMEQEPQVNKNKGFIRLEYEDSEMPILLSANDSRVRLDNVELYLCIGWKPTKMAVLSAAETGGKVTIEISYKHGLAPSINPESNIPYMRTPQITYEVEDFFSRDYFVENGEYKRSQKIILPQEIFLGEEGYIDLCVYVSLFDQEEIRVDYRVEDGWVYLTKN